MNFLPKIGIGIIASILLFTPISCADRGKKKSINGIWTQEGYGRIIEITDSTYSYYNITEISCLSLVSGKLKERFKIVRFNENELILNPGGIVNYSFKRSGTLPKICKTENSPINKSPEKNFEVFWNTFNKHYAFFEERNIDWDKVREKYLPVAKKISSDRELYELFIKIIMPFHDGHIKLDVPDSLTSTRKVKTGPEIKKSKSDVSADILKHYVSNPKSYNNDVIQWGYVNSSEVGYILISDMNNFSRYVSSPNRSEKVFWQQYNEKLSSKSPIEQFNDELDGVDFVMQVILKDLSGSKAIIIDLRFNGGGYETVALKLLSYFISKPKHVLSVRAKKGNGFTKEQKYTLKPAERNYKGQVFLLTSKRTASAAEIFALGALAYPEIKSFGSETNGIFSEILWKKLPNNWEFSLSNEIYSDSTGNEYEIIGVPANRNMDYPQNPDEFYNSFYRNSTFKDWTIEKILSQRSISAKIERTDTSSVATGF